MSFLDLTNVAASTFSPIKPGKYVASAKEAKVEDNFNKTGKKLVVRFKILDGEAKGREITSVFNVFHQNKEAETIGRQQLKALMGHIGLGDKLEDVNELLGKPVAINVKTEKKDDKEYSKIAWFEKTDAKIETDDIPF